MTISFRTDAQILEACDRVAKDLMPVSVRSVHAMVGGNWGQVATRLR